MPTHSGHILRPGATIYIAGPMTGYPLYNFPAFDTAFIQLKALGYNPISPADIDRQYGYDPAVDLEKNFPSKEDCVTRDVAAIVKSDCIVLMPGWETSKGSNMEKCVAEFLGRPVFLYDPKRPGIFITPSPTQTRLLASGFCPESCRRCTGRTRPRVLEPQLQPPMKDETQKVTHGSGAASSHFSPFSFHNPFEGAQLTCQRFDYGNRKYENDNPCYQQANWLKAFRAKDYKFFRDRAGHAIEHLIAEMRGEEDTAPGGNLGAVGWLVEVLAYVKKHDPDFYRQIQGVELSPPQPYREVEDGYRLLKPGEVIQDGDEYRLQNGMWRETKFVGCTYIGPGNPGRAYRRKVVKQ